MNLDTFFLSLVFDNAKTKDSSDKVEQTINNLTEKVLRGFAKIEAFEFLKTAIQQTITLTTKLDNLSYATNDNIQSLSAWGEAVKRNGGTAEGFYSSISNLAQKLRDVQTNFGSAGQLVFARLGLNLQKSNGHMKTATELLGDIGDKFKNLPKVWQLNLGQQLGLDQQTIRLLSNGSKSALELVNKMRQLGAVKDDNTEKNIRFRNSLYDIQLIWQSIKITIANGLIPVLTKFSEILVRSFRFMQEHAQLAKGILLAIAAILGGAILNSIAAIASAIMTRLIPALIKMAVAAPELYVLAAGLLAVGLLVEDFVVYLRGGKSAFEDYYKFIGKLATKFDHLAHSIFKTANILKYLFAVSGPVGAVISLFSHFGGDKKLSDEDFTKQSDSYVPLKDQGTNKDFIKNTIANVAKSLGFDPSTAATIANIESGLDPNAKPKPIPGKKITASGLFQVQDGTFLDQIGDLQDKNDPMKNSMAGIMYLKTVSKGLSDFLGRKPTGGELYLGERFGVEGSKKIFQANPNAMAAAILSPGALGTSSDVANMTKSQIINYANQKYASHAVSVGNVSINVHAPNSNPSQVGQAVMQQFNSKIVTNRDNGVRQ